MNPSRCTSIAPMSYELVPADGRFSKLQIPSRMQEQHIVAGLSSKTYRYLGEPHIWLGAQAKRNCHSLRVTSYYSKGLSEASCTTTLTDLFQRSDFTHGILSFIPQVVGVLSRQALSRLASGRRWAPIASQIIRLELLIRTL